MVSKFISNLEKSIEALEIMELETLPSILRFKNIELRNIVSLLQNHTPTVPLLYSDFTKLEEFPFRIWGVVINLTRQYPKKHDSDIDDLGQIVLDLHNIVQYSMVVSSPTKTFGRVNIESGSETVSKAIDLAVIGDAMNNLGDDSNKVNPPVHVDLVLDHSDVPKSKTMVQISIHSDVASEMVNAACVNHESILGIKHKEVSNVSNDPSSIVTDQSSFAKLYDFPLADVNYIDPYFKSYATLIDCVCNEGKLVEAHEVFVEMIERGLKSNRLCFCFNDLGVAQRLINESDLKLFDNIFVLRNILKNDDACISCIASNSSLADTNDMLKCKINVGEMKVFIFDPGGNIFQIFHLITLVGVRLTKKPYYNIKNVYEIWYTYGEFQEDGTQATEDIQLFAAGLLHFDLEEHQSSFVVRLTHGDTQFYHNSNITASTSQPPTSDLEDKVVFEGSVMIRLQLSVMAPETSATNTIAF